MIFQREHLPQDRPASREEEWGFSLQTFMEEQWPYIIAILFVLGVFLYARSQWRKRNRK